MVTFTDYGARADDGKTPPCRLSASIEEGMPEVRDQREQPERMSAANDAADLRKDAKRRTTVKPEDTYETLYAYQRADTDADRRERYTRRQASHVEKLQRSDTEFAGREATARRALQYAERHGTSYEDALTASGGSMPTEILPSRAV
jgi:hypothetical protein